MILALLVAFACAEEPVPPSGPATAHPGQIVFVDLTAKTEKTRPAAEVPETIAWATVGGKRVPVVRVESAVMGGGREIKRFGADGALIDVTVGR